MLRVFGHLFMALAAIVVALPILIVCSAALNGGRTMFFPPQDMTLARFGEFFFSEPVWTQALWNSVIVAVGSATLAVLLAWPIAYGLWKTGSRGSQFLAGLGSVPFALPPIVFGVGLGFFWAFLGGLGSIWAGIISHAVLFLALPLV
jgi:putative spermidine/putrescine transport system permease protein